MSRAPEEPPVRVHLNRAGEWEELAGRADLLRRAARLALGTADPPVRGEVSVTCLDAEAIARLNRDWLEREGPTDVLAFRLDGDGPVGEGPVGDGPHGNASDEDGPAGNDDLLGDVYVCPDVAAASAREAGGDVLEEVVRLVIHGVLHVLGHEHPGGDERWSSPMYRLQERLVEEALADRP